MILQVLSSVAAIKASSYSNGAIRARFFGARFRLASVKAASFDIFSSLVVKLPVATSPMRRSMQRDWLAIFSLSSVFYSWSLIVQRISRQPSLVSRFELTSKFTKFCKSLSFTAALALRGFSLEEFLPLSTTRNWFSRYFSFPEERLSLRRHSTH